MKLIGRYIFGGKTWIDILGEMMSEFKGREEEKFLLQALETIKDDLASDGIPIDESIRTVPDLKKWLMENGESIKEIDSAFDIQCVITDTIDEMNAYMKDYEYVYYTDYDDMSGEWLLEIGVVDKEEG